MSRQHRTHSVDDIYHVGSRGVGKQLIYEDDEDRRAFLGILKYSLEKCGGDIIAWCLMSNHYHLIVHLEMDRLSMVMRNLNSIYATTYNNRHERKGHLFENRFWSEPISKDGQLLSAVRYVHCNPQKAGISTVDAYPWSSYHEYFTGGGITNTNLVLDMLGGVSSFASFHEEQDDAAFCEGYHSSIRISDEEAFKLSCAILGITDTSELLTLPTQERNAKLRELKGAGIPCNQLQRLTGIGRNIIAKA